MANWDPDNKLATVKVVYYGPALSGKTTNLIALHEKLPSHLKGDVQILETQNDRTLFFDLLPLGVRAPDGLLIKIKLFTVPGQVVHDSTRKAVLSRADGVVFVADSQLSQSENNAESFENLARNASKVGLEFDSLPLVIQFNKRDMQNIVSEHEIRSRWQSTHWPILFTSAINGEGVVETLSNLMQQIYRILDQDHQMMLKHQLDEKSFMSQLFDHR